MPDVNLIKDTQGLNGGRKKPFTPMTPELSKPDLTPSSGLGGFFKNMFARQAKPLTPAAPATSAMSFKRTNGSDEHILQETRKAAPAVIPLPEDDDTGYNVNLLSEELVTTVSAKQRFIVLGLVVIGSALVIGAVYGGLTYYQQRITSSITNVEAQLATVRQQSTTLAKDQQVAVSATKKLAAISDLIDRHKQWTKFFGLLEKYTLQKVTYGPAFSGDINGSLSLSATTDSYETVAQQYLIFKQLVADKKFISAFSITGATSTQLKEGGSTVHFTVAMTLLPEDFTVSAAAAAGAASSSNASGSTTAPSTNTSLPVNRP